MTDLISRQAAIKAIDDLPNCYNGYSDTYDKAYIIGVLEELPTVEPVKHGKWVKTGQGFLNPNKFRNYCCSKCKTDIDEHIRIKPNYCPNCGAKMDL